MKKRVLALLLAGAAVASLAACGSQRFRCVRKRFRCPEETARSWSWSWAT